MNSLSKLLAIKSYRPRWYIITSIILPLIIAISSILLLKIGIHNVVSSEGIIADPPTLEQQHSVTYSLDLLSNFSVQLFAMVFCAGCFLVSVIVLVVTLPIYLLSNNESRIERAGGLVKSCLKFILVSGGGVLATLSF